MENQKILFRSRGKEKINISQFGASSSQEFHSIQDFGWESNFERSLLKSKSEPDLKDTQINPSRLESYLLNSLWQNLQHSLKVEERNPVVQNLQPYIPQNVQTPLAFQAPPFVPNPPRPMVARFYPLALPAILHDLPQNYAQRISLYDGEGNFTVRQQVDRFHDFIDLEEVDDDDVKMRLFAQSLSGEAMKWFTYLPAR